MKFKMIIICVLASLFVVALVNVAVTADKAGKQLSQPSAKKVKGWQSEVEKITGRKFKKTIACQPVDEKSMLEVMQKQVKRNSSEREIRDSLALMGVFVPEVNDIKTADLLKYMSKVAYGLYVPEDDKYYYIDTGVEAIENEVAIHELTHAMQDQCFDLAKFIKNDMSNLDRASARLALIEGEAVSVAAESQFRANKVKGLIDLEDEIGDNVEALSSAQQLLKTGVISDSFIFPYVHGSNFYQRFIKKHGWGKSAILYKSPPTSTEQIIHKNKFIAAKDYPVIVKFKLAAGDFGKGWKVLQTTTIGEFYLKLLMGANQQDDKIASWRAVIGWDGDKWIFCRNDKDGSVAAVGVTVWDSAKDAGEFFKFAKKHLEKRWKKDYDKRGVSYTMGGASETKGQYWKLEGKDGRTNCVRLNGKKVEIVINCPSKAVAGLEKSAKAATITFDKNDTDKGANDEKTTLEAEKIFITRLEKKYASAKVSGNVVTSKTGDCQLILPKDDWDTSGKSPSPLCSIYATCKKITGGSINLTETPSTGIKNLADAVKQLKAVYPTMFKGFKLISEKATKLGGLPAHSFTISILQSGMTVQMTQVFTIKNGKFYTITYGATPADYGKIKILAEKALKTFKFVEKTDSPPTKEPASSSNEGR